MIGIYKITSPSGKTYIGQTWDSVRRFNNYSNLYCKSQTKLYNSFNKYGFYTHTIEIIHELPFDINQSVMNNYEEYYMNQYKESGIELLNIRLAGSRGKHSEESKMKMRRPKGFPRTKSHSINNKIKRMKPILQYSTEGLLIKEWNSSVEAYLEYGKNVSQCLNKPNVRKTAYGFVWKFKYIKNGKSLTINQYNNLTDNQ